MPKFQSSAWCDVASVVEYRLMICPKIPRASAWPRFSLGETQPSPKGNTLGDPRGNRVETLETSCPLRHCHHLLTETDSVEHNSKLEFAREGTLPREMWTHGNLKSLVGIPSNQEDDRMLTVSLQSSGWDSGEPIEGRGGSSRSHDIDIRFVYFNVCSSNFQSAFSFQSPCKTIDVIFSFVIHL